jgi:hypothetical protein
LTCYLPKYLFGKAKTPRSTYQEVKQPSSQGPQLSSYLVIFPLHGLASQAARLDVSEPLGASQSNEWYSASHY